MDLNSVVNAPCSCGGGSKAAVPASCDGGE